jgi:hypothetical protein
MLSIFFRLFPLAFTTMNNAKPTAFIALKFRARPPFVGDYHDIASAETARTDHLRLCFGSGNLDGSGRSSAGL